MTLHVTDATETDLADLADVAARTFPLACPPTATPENIAAFIDTHLRSDRFRDYLTDPDHRVLTARDDGRIVGYALLVRGVIDDVDVQRAVPDRPAVEVSKCYVLPDAHGTGAAAALMTAAIERAGKFDAACMWLGVNQMNARAQRFYAKHGFRVTGTKTFRLGEGIEQDYVMVRGVNR